MQSSQIDPFNYDRKLKKVLYMLEILYLVFLFELKFQFGNLLKSSNSINAMRFLEQDIWLNFLSRGILYRFLTIMLMLFCFSCHFRKGKCLLCHTS